jgi:hypothetical protein
MPEKTENCGAAILKCWLISDYLLCCIALTEYMLCILWIAHDFIALEIIVFVDFPVKKLISMPPSASHQSISRMS